MIGGREMLEYIWQYSKYYGDMLATTKRLYDDEEYYASIMILFNATELICKSVRDNYAGNFANDLKWLNEHGLLNDEDYSFLDGKENGIRSIRNIMMHRDAYQYCLESENGKALPFTESDTWQLVYDSYAPRIIEILSKLVRTQLISELNFE